MATTKITATARGNRQRSSRSASGVKRKLSKIASATGSRISRAKYKAATAVIVALCDHSNAARAETGHEIGIFAARPAGPLNLCPQRAANFDNEIFPFRIAHGLPIALQQRGFLQLSRRDLIATLDDQALKPLL